MVDLIKIRVEDIEIIDKFYNDPRLTTRGINKYRNVYKEKFSIKEAKTYKGILFLFQDKFLKSGERSLKIIIKPHYYFNNYKHNSNDFTVFSFQYVINEILDDLGIYRVEKYKVINIEFGLNFELYGYGKELIVFAEYWKRNRGLIDNEYSYSKKFGGFKSDGKFYFYKLLKFYCKGIQLGVTCSEETLRFEIKSMESDYIKTLGINNIGDFLDLDSFERMREEILAVVKDLLIIDGNIVVNQQNMLNTRQQKKLLAYLNPHTWYRTLQLNDRTAFNHKKKRYFELLDKTGYNVHRELKKVISEKLDFLIDFIPNYSFETSTYSSEFFLNEISTYSNLNIVRMCWHLPFKGCEITGLDISLQKECSKTLSTKGVYFYYDNYPEIYKQLERRFLMPEWSDCPMFFQFSKIAHNIRIYKSNTKNQQERLYPKQQFRLFKLPEKKDKFEKFSFNQNI